MCNPIGLGAAIALLVLCISAMTTYAIISSRGEPARTPTHTVEQYHGNWWSTWHTPRQDRWMTMLGAATLGTAVALVITAVVAAAGCC